MNLYLGWGHRFSFTKTNGVWRYIGLSWFFFAQKNQLKDLVVILHCLRKILFLFFLISQTAIDHISLRLFILLLLNYRWFFLFERSIKIEWGIEIAFRFGAIGVSVAAILLLELTQTKNESFFLLNLFLGTWAFAFFVRLRSTSKLSY